MKKIAWILSVLAACFTPLIISCGDVKNTQSPVYDLRILSRLSQEFDSPASSRSIRTHHKKIPGPVFIQRGQEPETGIRGKHP